MRHHVAALLLVCFPSAAMSAPASAPADAPGSKPPAEASAQGSAPAAPLEAVVRGFYLEMRLGLDYTVKSSTIPADVNFPTLQGQSEGFGFGTQVDLAIGYEIASFIAVQLVGGATLVGGRADRVRGLSLAFGGLGVRLALPLTERFNLVLTPNIIYAHADTAVDPATSGAGLLASFGFEYFVHVRHFSLGVDLTANVPFSPLRAVLGLAPHLRYTF